MSRQTPNKTATSAGRPGDTDDICPVCKSSRYLNKSMRFLVNPECYHKMCESCVDRIFSHGPNKCPIAGCNRTLRKHKFREQTFGDIQVEREVDIRRRVAATFNRREDEFDTLLDYNNYLNDVEDITFNLINKIDVEETERKMQSYSQQNAKVISQNASIAAQEAQDMSALQAAEREQARLRREATRREEDEERRAKRDGRENMLNRLAAGGDATELAAEQKLAQRQKQDSIGANGTALSRDMIIKGLKTKKAPEPDQPFDAFDGWRLQPKFYTVHEKYEWPWLNNLRSDPVIIAGGYDIQEFHTRAICEAFAGLTVFVKREKKDSNVAQGAMEEGTLGTVGAAQVSAV